MQTSAAHWRRPGEWFLLAALIVVLLFVFMHYARQVQAQAELAAIQTTVGALRTALVLDHLQKQLPRAPGAASLVQNSRNPFDLVKQKPLGYVGEISKAQANAAPPGSWFYADDCPCIGYRPMDGNALNSPSGELVIWYQVDETTGISQLTPRESYRWSGKWLG